MFFLTVNTFLYIVAAINGSIGAGCIALALHLQRKYEKEIHHDK